MSEKPSRRRSEEVAGYVNFPIGKPGWKNTGEGGMFVRLVVEDVGDYDSKWVPCCGGYQTVLYDECLQGDDVNPEPKALPTEEEMAAMSPAQVRAALDESTSCPAEDYHFPGMREAHNPEAAWSRYASIAYLAVLTLGATGWSGYHEEQGYFRCTYADLTDAGKALYDSLVALYPGRKLFLQTWIDT